MQGRVENELWPDASQHEIAAKPERLKDVIEGSLRAAALLTSWRAKSKAMLLYKKQERQDEIKNRADISDNMESSRSKNPLNSTQPRHESQFGT